jgi:Replication protein
MLESRKSPDACLTSVQPSETKPHPLEVQSGAQHRLHAGVQDKRAQVINAFWNSGKERLVKRAEKLGMCGVSPIVRLEVGRRPALCPGRCRDRLCPLCSRLRGRQVRHRITALVAKADSVRFATFTMARTEDGLGERIDAVLKAFSALRRRKAWKQRVKGGLFVVETTRGAKGEHWHVHLHVLIEGDYFPHALLKAEWQAASGGASIVDIRAVHGRQQAVNYVAKYVSKGADVEAWDDDTVCEFAEGVHRRRLMGTFGKWHKVDVNEDREDDEPDVMPRHGVTFASLREAIVQGTLDREETVSRLWQMGYLWRLLLGEFVDEEPEVTGWPGAACFDAMTRTLLDVSGQPATAYVPIEPVPAKRPETGSLFGTTHHV